MKIGLAGTGRIGAFHAKTLIGLPEVDELVLFDVVPESAARVADEVGRHDGGQHRGVARLRHRRLRHLVLG